MDLSKNLSLVSRYFWFLVLVALLAGLTTFILLVSQPPAYAATTDLLVGPALDSPSPDLNALRIGGQLVQTYAELVRTDAFLEAVNSKLAQKVDLDALRSSISTRQSIETRILTIIVEYPDPGQAAAIANAAAEALIETSPARDNVTASLRGRMIDQAEQLEAIVSESRTVIEQLQTELAALRDAGAASSDAATINLEQQNLLLRQLAEERTRLSDALRTLATVYQILLGTDTNQIVIIQPATSATAVDRQIGLRVITSAIGGLIFGLILVFAVDHFDDRVRFPADLGRAAGVPLLGAISRYNRRRGTGVERLIAFAKPGSEAAGRYREAAAKLLYSVGESTPYTMLISSVGSRAADEAAVTAGNLAVAFARGGYQVALVDAQLDRPALTALFRASKKEGLADLAMKKSPNPQLIPIETVAGVRFLPAGSATETGARALMSPVKVSKLMEQLKNEADIILLASSPITRFAETLTLASQVDGVVLVARHADSTTATINKVVENFHLMKVNLLGVIFDYNPASSLYLTDRRIGFGFKGAAAGGAHPAGSLSEQSTEG